MLAEDEIYLDKIVYVLLFNQYISFNHKHGHRRREQTHFYDKLVLKLFCLYCTGHSMNLILKNLLEISPHLHHHCYQWEQSKLVRKEFISAKAWLSLHAFIYP
jgi:hypothetical protein